MLELFLFAVTEVMKAVPISMLIKLVTINNDNIILYLLLVLFSQERPSLD